MGTSDKRRKVELVSISDVHLGTYGCHAKELNRYLKSISPTILILNGDIIDIWQFSKSYWPNTHTKILKQILHLASKGTKVYYLTGNHDEKLRKFEGLEIGNIQILNSLELTLAGKRTWFFHGDIFDVVMQHSKWLAKLGAISYDALILLNVVVDKISSFFGREKVSLSKRVKNNVKSAVKFMNDFENTAATLALNKGFEALVCGHIHQPKNTEIEVEGIGSVQYLNSGDWIENLTALEFDGSKWSIYKYNEDENMPIINDAMDDNEKLDLVDLNEKELFANMLAELQN